MFTDDCGTMGDMLYRIDEHMARVVKHIAINGDDHAWFVDV